MNDSGFQDEFLDNNYNECDAPPKFNVVISTLIGSVLAMIGICSNLFLLYVFLRKKRNITTFLYYVVLAILDLLMCISYIVWLGNYKLSQYFELSFLYDLCSEYVFFVNWISKIIQMSIPYIIIAATAERLERIANINPVVKT
uniref:G_PROTEIN_RECEP_F1_2 domain-containing protein n=1 Tax=Rhabditophanes sp. KR3021 TaxID=114890 RepID=A0AC35U7M0_9BILA